jgi:2-C-methyl-D-erythritol 4-phosphate cytidylyltransferase
LSRGGLEEGRRLCESESWRDVTLCVGGARRQDSVRNGLDALVECDWVIVHDGARPAMDASLIERGLSMAKQHGAAIAAVPVKDTIKAVNGSMLVEKTLPRKQLWAVQTPQIFARDVLRRAHNEVSHDVTDDAAMVEAIGLPVAIFHGDYENIKVTTAEDVHLAESILRRRRAAARPT